MTDEEIMRHLEALNLEYNERLKTTLELEKKEERLLAANNALELEYEVAEEDLAIALEIQRVLEELRDDLIRGRAECEV